MIAQSTGTRHALRQPEAVVPDLFQRIDAPSRQGQSRINALADWYTWSPSSRQLLQAWCSWVPRLPQPKLISVTLARSYGRSFHLPVSSLPNTSLRRSLLQFATTLSAFDPKEKLALFSGLIDSQLSGRALHYLFAYLRALLVHETHDQMAAIHAPLGTVGPNVGSFPLHCDLYVPDMLLCVYDNVVAGGGGASTFLHVPDFVELLRKSATLPRHVLAVITDLVDSPLDADAFDVFFHLIHGAEHPWVRDLRRHLARNQLRITLKPGQGYLLNDRRWLHGRQSVRGALPGNRLYRLVFGSMARKSTSRRSK